MKERPILFSGEMVRAILEGRKTQTRRIIKYVPPQVISSEIEGEVCYFRSSTFPNARMSYSVKCPYGQVGDRLWVRESFRLSTQDDCSCYEYCFCRIGSPMYSADFNGDRDWGPWKPSIHMPRWASRINLEITDIRVERLQDITGEDVKAEGIEKESRIEGFSFDLHQEFINLWESINGEKSWYMNPWVWVIEFRRIG